MNLVRYLPLAVGFSPITADAELERYIVLPISFSSFTKECGRKLYMRCPEGIAESANADCAFGPHLIGPGTVRLNAKKTYTPSLGKAISPQGCRFPGKLNWKGYIKCSLFLILTGVMALASNSIAAAADAKESLSLSALKLEDCLDLALRKNFQIQNLKEQIESQHAVVLETRGRLFPSLDLIAEYSRVDPGRVQTVEGQQFGSKKNWTADISVRHDLYSGGRDTALLKRERLSEQAALHELRAVVNTVLAAVKGRFYSVLLADARIAVQKEHVKLLEEELRYQRSRFEAGTVSDFNVLRAEVALANSRTPLIRAENALPLAIEELRRDIGLELNGAAPIQSVISVNGELDFRPRAFSLEQALTIAEKERPELLQLALELESAGQLREAATAEYLPNLSIGASYGADKSQFSDDLDDEYHGWKAGVQTSWNLFNGFQTKGRVQQAESAASLVRIQRAKQRLDIEVEVRRAHANLTEAHALVSASIQVVTQAEESYRLARARADAGSATQLDVLDSQVALTEARTNKIQALFDYNLALAEMERALGELSYSGTGTASGGTPLIKESRTK